MLAFLNRTVLTALVACIAETVLPCRVSFIVGSYAAFFSLGHCLTPLMGRYGGILGSVCYYGIRTLIKALRAQALSNLIVVYHVPTLLGTLYASGKEAASEHSGLKGLLLKMLLSAASFTCIILFIAHSTGIQAWPYTLFWLIPALVPFIKIKHFFIDALASTFFAHAVGSIIYLYSNPMTPSIWLSLIPVVILERLFFALGAFALQKISFGAIKHFKHYYIYSNRASQTILTKTF